MPDMLVNLMRLPTLEPSFEMESGGVVIRRAQPFEHTRVRSFIEKTFSVAWADEISVGFSHQPITIYIAVLEQELVGFAAYECTRKGFFGPMGVSKDSQGQGVGRALLLACLSGLRELGYVYGVIGRVGPVEFYKKAVGAVVIPDSDPGIYTDLLK